MSKANGNSDGTSVHFALQGKGGVGKSLIASVLSQFFVWKDRALHAVDADPVNQTLAEYRALGVERLNLLKEGSVDQRQFDTLMERILTETGTFVVDTGASTFIPLALPPRKQGSGILVWPGETCVRAYRDYGRASSRGHVEWFRPARRDNGSAQSCSMAE